eukprot:TRINITY_DN15058_c2_g1_i2.p1 TRINITY_DN15058_c2_g1~~TRINITY_DN15058_c2_g1_i2.p1  ORF type:complete len:203 (+),score=36.62 TRINITY_DN15058_c2_g1_i2:288-896(+)
MQTGLFMPVEREDEEGDGSGDGSSNGGIRHRRHENDPKKIHGEASDAGHASQSVGVVASGALLALATALCSGVAAAMSQAAMRTSSRHSALFNLELGLWGLPLVLASGGGPLSFSEACRGWEFKTFAPVALQAVGGLLVSAVVKSKGGVAMGLCTVVGIAISALVGAVRTGQPPTLRQVCAAALCTLSVAMHQTASAPAKAA